MTYLERILHQLAKLSITVRAIEERQGIALDALAHLTAPPTPVRTDQGEACAKAFCGHPRAEHNYGPSGRRCGYAYGCGCGEFAAPTPPVPDQSPRCGAIGARGPCAMEPGHERHGLPHGNKFGPWALGATPSPVPDQSPPGFRIVGRSGPGVAFVAGTWVRCARLTTGQETGDEPTFRQDVAPDLWLAGCYDLLEPIPQQASAPGPASTCDDCINDRDCNRKHTQPVAPTSGAGEAVHDGECGVNCPACHRDFVAAGSQRDGADDLRRQSLRNPVIANAVVNEALNDWGIAYRAAANWKALARRYRGEKAALESVDGKNVDLKIRNAVLQAEIADLRRAAQTDELVRLRAEREKLRAILIQDVEVDEADDSGTCPRCFRMVTAADDLEADPEEMCHPCCATAVSEAVALLRADPVAAQTDTTAAVEAERARCLRLLELACAQGTDLSKTLAAIKGGDAVEPRTPAVAALMDFLSFDERATKEGRFYASFAELRADYDRYKREAAPVQPTTVGERVSRPGKHGCHNPRCILEDGDCVHHLHGPATPEAAQGEKGEP